MKKMVLAINIIAFIYACHTGDATAFAVAFLWFACTCYKDIYRIWYKILL